MPDLDVRMNETAGKSRRRFMNVHALCRVATLMGLLCGCSGPAPPSDLHAPEKAELEPGSLPALVDSLAASALKQGPIAGMSVAVMRGDRLVLGKGYGIANREQATPATAQTRYDIASITKLFTAAAIMKLADAGKLRLEDDLSTLLPSFPNRAQGRRISVRHLLSHTSGLADYEGAHTEVWTKSGTLLTPAFVIDFVRGRDLEFEPGTRWSYSNTAFYLLALIVERVSGLPYRQYVRDEIALPLGLADTLHCDEVRSSQSASRGYAPDGDTLVPSPLFTLPDIRGDGGLCSTVGDLARLPAALLQGKVVSDTALAEMMKPTRLANGVAVDYGFGMRFGQLDGHRLWGHTGGMTSYWSVLAHYPDDDATIVVLVNTDGSAEDALTIEGHIARAVLGLGEPKLLDRALSAADPARFVGRYVDGTDIVRVFEEAGRIKQSAEGGDGTARALLYQGENVFGWATYPMDRLVFHAAAGPVTGMSEYYNGLFAAYRHRDVAHDRAPPH